MEKYIINKNATILQALQSLNALSDAGLTLFVVDEKNVVLGTVTDGDIRRSLIAGTSLTDGVCSAMNKNITLLSSKSCDVSVFKKIRSLDIRVVPIVDENRKLVGVFDSSRMRSMLPIDAVLMAGGKGERLRPLTEKTPKPLVKVGDKCIIDYNIDRLIEFGVKNISVTVNYLKEQIHDHFAEPRRGVKIDTVEEPKFLGTIGSIQFVKEFRNDTILVMNSDLFTNIDFEDFYLHFKEHDAMMSVAAVPYTINVPYGIFDLDGREIKGVKEKPIYNYYANAGIYLFKREALDLIPKDTFFNATDLIDAVTAKGERAIRYPLSGYWIDIGQHADLAKAQDLVRHLR
ncbi:nucleotidyltransferase family protein [Candidatus Saccharibacteria bacterium]|nr:nucleotidyltransferase family protein [Candidatus Saccharibacteria bacterium]